MRKWIGGCAAAVTMLLCGIQALGAAAVQSEPAQAAEGVIPNSAVKITFDENILFGEDDVTINGGHENIQSVSVNGQNLKISTKNQEEGANYRVEVNGGVCLSYTTGFIDEKFLLDYTGPAMADFYSGRKMYAESVEMENECLVMVTGEQSQKGGRFFSVPVNMNPRQAAAVELGVRISGDSPVNIYYSDRDNYTGFHNENKLSIQAAAGNDFASYRIDLAENEAWNAMEKIGQLMIEAEKPGALRIEIGYFRILDKESGGQAGFDVGKFRICTGYGTGEEKDITGKPLPGGEVFGVLDAIRNNTRQEENVTIVLGYYQEGRLTAVQFLNQTVQPESSLYGLALPIQTQPEGYVRAFLRRGVRDIRTIAPGVSTAVEAKEDGR